jgi:hypothetical protein
MSEAVEILIKADDQASAALETVATNAQKAGGKTTNAFKESGKNVKATSDLFAQLAAMSGNSQIAGLAQTVSGISEKVGQFSEVSKTGKLGALGFKLGLMGLAATAGFAVGKALADVIWKTAEFERSMARAKETAADLDAQLKRNNATLAANVREDIELIRNPEEKQAAYQKLFDELNGQIVMSSQLVKMGEKDVEAWGKAWQITGNRKQYALDAQEQLKGNKETLSGLKAQRDELAKIVGVRGQEVAAIRTANAAKDKSESFLENLRQEVKYLQASREEQVKIEALRNTTAEDRGEAERLLKDRDAIKAKQEAEREAAQERTRQQDEAARAAEKAAEAAQQEVQRIEDIIAAERERMQLQQIEREQGKEAAAAQALINRGLDAETAKQLAAEQAAQDKADEAARLKNKEGPEKASASAVPTLTAQESRLLTRGPADRGNELLERAVAALQKIMASSSATATATNSADTKLGFIDDNTSNTVQMVPVT